MDHDTMQRSRKMTPQRTLSCERHKCWSRKSWI
jgi:hypothetical protein